MLSMHQLSPKSDESSAPRYSAQTTCDQVFQGHPAMRVPMARLNTDIYTDDKSNGADHSERHPIGASGARRKLQRVSLNGTMSRTTCTPALT